MAKKKANKKTVDELILQSQKILSEKNQAEIKNNQQEKSDYGILLIAFGHPYYSHMAFNLAATLKASAPDIQIAIIKQDNSLSQLSEGEQKIFDHIIEAKTEWTHGIHGLDFFKMKLHLNEATPFKRTLFIDADTIWCDHHSPHELFNEFYGKSFYSSNRGEVNTESENIQSGFFLNINQVKEVYALDKIFDLSSEVMYFENADCVFEKAQSIYNENKLSIRSFGKGLPDEVFLSIASSFCKIEMQPFSPSYWQSANIYRFHSQEYILSHYLLSCGGAGQFPPHIRKLYLEIAQRAFMKLGIKKHPYQLIAKSSILSERQKV